jgi:transposase-like protein
VYGIWQDEGMDSIRSRRRSRRSWTDTDKARLIARWRQSGVSKLEFCRGESLCYSGFLRWIREERSSKQGGGFLEVQVPAASPTRASTPSPVAVEVISPTGWTLRVPEALSVTRVKELLTLVAAC